MKKVVFIIFSIFLLVILYFVSSYFFNQDMDVSFSKCIDGDTAWFMVQGEKKKVRLIAIDAPEMGHDGKEGEAFSREASEYTCSLLKRAEHISLQFDSYSDYTDQYGRILAWVFVDGHNLNQLLVANGYAMVRYVYHDYLYVDDLCEAQKNAYMNELGIWKNSGDLYAHNYCYKK